jgi:hypothetical protein
VTLSKKLTAAGELIEVSITKRPATTV